MSERIQQDRQSVVEAVVSGDADRLSRSLKRLADSCPGSFLHYTSELIKTEHAKRHSLLCASLYSDAPPFYFEDGVVYGATYTQGDFLCKDAHRAGTGIAHHAVVEIVAKARSGFDETVLKKVIELKSALAEIDRLLVGHSSCDNMLSGLARVDLLKAHALLLASLKMPACYRDHSGDGDLKAAIDAWR